MTLLPRSLAGRIFALYAAAMATVAVATLALFLGHQVGRQIDGTRRDAEAVLSLLLPVVTDAAVLGDFDTIGRQLRNAAHHSSIARANFVDASGARLQVEEASPSAWAPALLRERIGEWLGHPSAEVTAGGIRYGELHLEPDAEALTAALVRLALGTLTLVAAGSVAVLWFVRAMLRRWLGHLDRIEQLGDELEGGRHAPARESMAQDAPLEFRRTFEALDRAAVSLRAERGQAVATLQAIDDAVLACDVDGRIVLTNEAAERLLGRAASELAGEPLTAVLPALSNATSSPQALPGRWKNRELLWTAPDGLQHVLDSNLSPIVDAQGQTIGQVLACRDVTEQHARAGALRAVQAARDAALAELRKSLEADEHGGGAPRAETDDLKAVSRLVSQLFLRLRERTAQLDAIFQLSPDGFVSFDRWRQVRYASPGFTELTGLSSDMVIGLEEPVLVQRLRSRCRQGQPLHGLAPPVAGGRHLVELARPRVRTVELSVHAGGSDAVSQVLHLRDVTHESEVDRMKSEFVAAAAHELRTPMVSIYGFSELLVTRQMPPERQKLLLERIHRQCEVMTRILEELLDLARIEARRGADFLLVDTDVGALVEAVIADLCPPDERGAPVWQPAPRPLHARIDVDKVQRALRNLLSNAYKYSAEGSEVVVRLIEEPGAGRLGIEVEDHGIGMTTEQLARVGERFYRADNTGTRLGTGLGVSLVREIATLHGGMLALRSEPGRGTVATLWLPQAPVEAAAVPAGAVPRLAAAQPTR